MNDNRAGATLGLFSVALVGFLCLAVGHAYGDTFVWNGDGITSGTGDPILDTAGNWSPTTTPSVNDVATVTLNSSASLGQSAGLDIGTFAVTTLQGGTITFSQNNTFSGLSVAGSSNIVVSAGTTTVTNSFTQSGGSTVILVTNGGVLYLPTSYSNSGVINILGTVVGTASSAAAPSGLTGLFHFEQATTFTDSASSPHSITLFNSPSLAGVGSSTVPKVGDGAGSFSSTGSGVKVTNTDLGTPQITVEGWIYSNNNGTYRTIASRSGQYLFDLLGTNIRLYYNSYGAIVTSTISVPNNAWTHVAFTGDGTALKLYVNGAAAGVFGAWTGNVTSSDVGIGYRADYLAGQYFPGQIDDLAFYNRVLSASEILAHYNLGNGGDSLTESYITSLLPNVSSGTISNLAGAQINVSDGGVFDASLPWFNNFGSLMVNSGGKAIFSNVGTQTGTITVADGGSIVGTAAWTNGGWIQLTGGTISGALLTNSVTVTGTGVISAPFVQNSGANLVASGGSLQLTSATAPVTNGTIRVTGNQLVVSATDWTVNGSLILGDGSIQTGGTMSLDNNLLDYGTITIGGGALKGSVGSRYIAAVGGTMTLDLTNSAGVQNIRLGAYLLGQSTNTIAFTNSFTFTDTINNSFIMPYNQTYVVEGGNGTMTLNTVGAGAVYFHSGVGTSGTIVGTVANAGLAAIYSGISGTSFTFTNGFYNLPGATFRANSAIQLNTDITNQGHLLQLVGTVNGNITSSGSMSNDTYAAFSWNGVFTNSGTIAEGFSRIVAVGANSQFVNKGTVESNYLPNQTYANGGYSFSIQAPNGGTITNDVTGYMLTRSGFGSLSLTGYIQNLGTMNGADKSIFFTGSTVTNESTGFLTGNLDLTGSRLNNIGTVSVSSGSRIELGTVTSQTGTITVNAGGLLKGTQNWTNNGYVSLSTDSEIFQNTDTGLINTGEIAKSGTGIGKIGGGMGLTENAGILRITGGTLIVNVASGLIGLWHFDTAGTFNDSSVFAHNYSTVSSGGFPTLNTVDFKVGDGAGSFNGGGYISVTDTTAVTNPNGNVLDPKEITIATWLNTGTAQTTNYPTFVSKYLAYLFWERFDFSGHPLQFYDGNNGKFLLSPTATPSGTWFYAAVTAGANGIKIYQNGMAVATLTTPYNPLNNTNNLTIGQRGDGYPFRGLMDELAIFNRVLSDAEILANYNLTAAGSTLTEQFIASQIGIGSFTNAVNGNVVVSNSVADFSNTEIFNLGTIVASSNAMVVLGTVTSQTGTITSTDSIISALQDWTNNGYIAITHSEIRTREGAGLFTNTNYISTGSSINSNFLNTGTFELTDNTSITGNFTNAGWTNLATSYLTVNGSINANTGDGITTGVLTGSGTYTLSPTDGEATFTNDITSAAAAGGNYDTRDLTFNMESGTINFEVTSTDMGSGAFSQLTNGYAMGTLTLPNTLTLLRLLDDTINQGGGTQEAIYVENLHLGTALTASNFDFGTSGLKIYYNHIIGDGGGDFVGTLDGAERVIYFGNLIPLGVNGPPSGVVPEPSTFALLLLGLPMLWFIWRRQNGKATLSRERIRQKGFDGR